jgi:hypothetical protein
MIQSGLEKILIEYQNSLDLNKFGKVIKIDSFEFGLTAKLSVFLQVKANNPAAFYTSGQLEFTNACLLLVAAFVVNRLP